MTKQSVILLGVTSALVLLVSATHSLGQRNDLFSTRPTISALPQSVKAPPDNPLIVDKIALGKLLFWDPVLSGNRDVACATCHHPFNALCREPRPIHRRERCRLREEPPVPTADPIPFVKRNSPTIVNVGFNGINQAGRVQSRERRRCSGTCA